MPKEWGNDKPNLSKFTKAVPKDHKELFDSLKELAENWGYVEKCGVVELHKAIMVDLGWLANTKKPDFYIPLQPLKIKEADKLVKALVVKVEKPAPIIEQDAISLFATVETSGK